MNEVDRNIAVVRRFLDEVVNGGNAKVLGELWADDLTWNGGSMGTLHGIEQFRAFNAANSTGAWEGMHLAVEDVIAQGNKVVVRFTNSGRNVGPFMGNPASGKEAHWLGIAIYTLEDGKIVEGWFGEDILHMLMQLDIVSLPGL